MSTRDEIFKGVQDKHDQRMDKSLTTIMSSDTVLEARTSLEAAVRALPGVSSDPYTVPDIIRIMDTYAFRVLVEGGRVSMDI
jgi:hypothetical protein